MAGKLDSSLPSVGGEELHSTIKKTINEYIDSLNDDLLDINRKIHSNPELGYSEVLAHANITALLNSYNIPTTSHTYNLPTSFQAEFGTGGRVLTYCAEYDALPEIGHACGHNLIATASIASFFGVVEALRLSKIPGRVRLLGTPAEEGGGGKIKLVEAGAFDDVDAAMMIHPTTPRSDGKAGVAYGTCLASVNFKVLFQGKAAHAAAKPWEGVNALDAATLGYVAVGMLRQHILPSDRINCVVKTSENAVTNVIVDSATILCGIRCKTIREAGVLKERVMRCFEGAALATGCVIEFTKTIEPYAELRPNETLCKEFTDAMAELGQDFACDLKRREEGSWGTDMGNVSQVCPSFHGSYVIQIQPGETIHGAGYARAAGTQESHDLTLGVAKGMAVAGWRFLADDEVARQAKEDFRVDKLNR